MSAFTEMVGNNIRVYRRANRLTLEDLSRQVHKSKATVGKYEQGTIAIDMDTLNDVATVLKVPPSLLLSEPKQPADTVKEPVSAGLHSYLYLYDGRAGRILKSLLVTSAGSDDTALFYDLQSFDEPQRCRALYCGTCQTHDFVTNYLLDSRTNKIEHLNLCLMRSLDRPTYSTGLISGISSRMFLPASAKCILSQEPLAENEELRDSLLLRKEDLKLTKHYNMFMVEQSGIY